MSLWIDRWMDGWTDGRRDGGMDGREKGWTGGHMMDGGMDGGREGGIVGWSKFNTHRWWNQHLCISDGLSVVQRRIGRAIEVVFFNTIYAAWDERNGQLAAGGVASFWKCNEFDPRLVHDNLSVFP